MTRARLAAVPAEEKTEQPGFRNVGMIGVECLKPLSLKIAELNFTNEIGYGNTVRLLRTASLCGTVECREYGPLKEAYDYAKALQKPTFTSIINPEDNRFLPDNAQCNRRKLPETNQSELLCARGNQANCVW